jgi:hypothetical protein
MVNLRREEDERTLYFLLNKPLHEMFSKSFRCALNAQSLALRPVLIICLQVLAKES